MALAALLGAASAGVVLVAALLGLGKNVVTKKEHAETCVSNLAPLNVEVVNLKEGQSRVESKVDQVLEVLYKMNGGKK
jgi:hypothetical protein